MTVLAFHHGVALIVELRGHEPAFLHAAAHSLGISRIDLPRRWKTYSLIPVTKSLKPPLNQYEEFPLLNADEEVIKAKARMVYERQTGKNWRTPAWILGSCQNGDRRQNCDGEGVCHIKRSADGFVESKIQMGM
jgi:hypothetical protein